MSEFESFKILQAAFRASPSATIISDKDGKIVLINTQAQALFGYESEELLDQPIEILMPERFRTQHPRYRKDFNSNPQTRFMGAGRDLFGLRRDGTEFPVEIGLNPTEDGTHIISSIVDITERKRIELEREKAREEAEVANRLKDEFLAVISHELRTPLQAIVGWSQMLISNSLEKSKIQKALQAIARSAKNQERLINDILDMSRMISGKLYIDQQVVDMVAIVQLVMESMLPDAKNKNITTNLEILTNPIWVSGDPDRLQQIIRNLISNAIKFTEPGGSISVNINVVDSSMQLTISDTGTGISPDFLPLVFERFRQGDSSHTRVHGGLGLGLAIVKHLVDLHRGNVSAQSPGLNKGSSFIVRLPIIPVWQGLSDEGEEKIRRHYDLRGMEILLIDDDIETREFIKTLLKIQGVEIMTSETAREGLEMIHEFKPNVIICDIEMPGEDGFSFIRKLRMEHKIKIPTIALTAHVKKEMDEKAINAGFTLFATKPIGPSELLNILAQIKAEYLDK